MLDGVRGVLCGSPQMLPMLQLLLPVDLFWVLRGVARVLMLLPGARCPGWGQRWECTSSMTAGCATCQKGNSSQLAVGPDDFFQVGPSALAMHTAVLGVGPRTPSPRLGPRGHSGDPLVVRSLEALRSGPGISRVPDSLAANWWQE